MPTGEQTVQQKTIVSLIDALVVLRSIAENDDALTTIAVDDERRLTFVAQDWEARITVILKSNLEFETAIYTW